MEIERGSNDGGWFNTNGGDIAAIGMLDRPADADKWNGIIPEVWIHSRHLTLAEHQHIYLATKWRYR